jgi:hypothetical protein
MEPNKYQVVEKLRDGSTITIRAIRPDDRDRFMHGFKQFITSPDSVRFRFHGFRRSLSDPEATDMTNVDSSIMWLWWQLLELSPNSRSSV